MSVELRQYPRNAGTTPWVPTLADAKLPQKSTEYVLWIDMQLLASCARSFMQYDEDSHGHCYQQSALEFLLAQYWRRNYGVATGVGRKPRMCWTWYQITRGDPAKASTNTIGYYAFLNEGEPSLDPTSLLKFGDTELVGEWMSERLFSKKFFELAELSVEGKRRDKNATLSAKEMKYWKNLAAINTPEKYKTMASWYTGIDYHKQHAISALNDFPNTDWALHPKNVFSFANAQRARIRSTGMHNLVVEARGDIVRVVDRADEYAAFHPARTETLRCPLEGSGFFMSHDCAHPSVLMNMRMPHLRTEVLDGDQDLMDHVKLRSGGNPSPTAAQLAEWKDEYVRNYSPSVNKEGDLEKHNIRWKKAIQKLSLFPALQQKLRMQGIDEFAGIFSSTANLTPALEAIRRHTMDTCRKNGNLYFPTRLMHKNMGVFDNWVDKIVDDGQNLLNLAQIHIPLLIHLFVVLDAARDDGNERLAILQAGPKGVGKSFCQKLVAELMIVDSIKEITHQSDQAATGSDNVRAFCNFYDEKSPEQLGAPAQTGKDYDAIQHVLGHNDTSSAGVGLAQLKARLTSRIITSQHLGFDSDGKRKTIESKIIFYGNESWNINMPSALLPDAMLNRFNVLEYSTAGGDMSQDLVTRRKLPKNHTNRVQMRDRLSHGLRSIQGGVTMTNMFIACGFLPPIDLTMSNALIDVTAASLLKYYYIQSARDGRPMGHTSRYIEAGTNVRNWILMFSMGIGGPDPSRPFQYRDLAPMRYLMVAPKSIAAFFLELPRIYSRDGEVNCVSVIRQIFGKCMDDDAVVGTRTRPAVTDKNRSQYVNVLGSVDVAGAKVVADAEAAAAASAPQTAQQRRVLARQKTQAAGGSQSTLFTNPVPPAAPDVGAGAGGGYPGYAPGKKEADIGEVIKETYWDADGYCVFTNFFKDDAGQVLTSNLEKYTAIKQLIMSQMSSCPSQQTLLCTIAALSNPRIPNKDKNKSARPVMTINGADWRVDRDFCRNATLDSIYNVMQRVFRDQKGVDHFMRGRLDTKTMQLMRGTFGNNADKKSLKALTSEVKEFKELKNEKEEKKAPAPAAASTLAARLRAAAAATPVPVAAPRADDAAMQLVPVLGEDGTPLEAATLPYLADIKTTVENPDYISETSRKSMLANGTATPEELATYSDEKHEDTTEMTDDAVVERHLRSLGVTDPDHWALPKNLKNCVDAYFDWQEVCGLMQVLLHNIRTFAPKPSATNGKRKTLAAAATATTTNKKQEVNWMTGTLEERQRLFVTLGLKVADKMSHVFSTYHFHGALVNDLTLTWIHKWLEPFDLCLAAKVSRDLLQTEEKKGADGEPEPAEPSAAIWESSLFQYCERGIALNAFCDCPEGPHAKTCADTEKDHAAKREIQTRREAILGHIEVNLTTYIANIAKGTLWRIEAKEKAEKNDDQSRVSRGKPLYVESKLVSKRELEAKQAAAAIKNMDVEAGDDDGMDQKHASSSKKQKKDTLPPAAAVVAPRRLTFGKHTMPVRQPLPPPPPPPPPASLPPSPPVPKEDEENQFDDEDDQASLYAAHQQDQIVLEQLQDDEDSENKPPPPPPPPPPAAPVAKAAPAIHPMRARAAALAAAAAAATAAAAAAAAAVPVPSPVPRPPLAPLTAPRQALASASKPVSRPAPRPIHKPIRKPVAPLAAAAAVSVSAPKATLAEIAKRALAVLVENKMDSTQKSAWALMCQYPATPLALVKASVTAPPPPPAAAAVAEKAKEQKKRKAPPPPPPRPPSPELLEDAEDEEVEDSDARTKRKAAKGKANGGAGKKKRRKGSKFIVDEASESDVDGDASDDEESDGLDRDMSDPETLIRDGPPSDGEDGPVLRDRDLEEADKDRDDARGVAKDIEKELRAKMTPEELRVHIAEKKAERQERRQLRKERKDRKKNLRRLKRIEDD